MDVLLRISPQSRVGGTPDGEKNATSKRRRIDDYG